MENIPPLSPRSDTESTLPDLDTPPPPPSTRPPLECIHMEHDLSKNFPYTYITYPVISAENICRLTSHINEMKGYINENTEMVSSFSSQVYELDYKLHYKLDTMEYNTKYYNTLHEKQMKKTYDHVHHATKRLDAYMSINDKMMTLNETKIQKLERTLHHLEKQLELHMEECELEKYERREHEEEMTVSMRHTFLWNLILSLLVLLLLFLK